MNTPIAEGTVIAKQPITRQEERTFYWPILFLRQLYIYDRIDILCYTFNARLIGSLNIKRVICAKLIFEAPKELELKLCKNLHSKMYICKRKRNTYVYVGSWNFNSPTYLEIMTRLPVKENKYAKSYFEELWKQL